MCMYIHKVLFDRRVRKRLPGYLNAHMVRCATKGDCGVCDADKPIVTAFRSWRLRLRLKVKVRAAEERGT